MRVLELSADIASMYVCNYVEEDGRCRPGRNNLIITGRSRRVHVPPDVLALYAYQASSLCIDHFHAEFDNITTNSGSLHTLSLTHSPTHSLAQSVKSNQIKFICNHKI